MQKLKNNEKGFGTVEAILLVVIVILIGAVGYLVYKNHHNVTTKVVTVTKTVTSPSKATSNNKTPAQQYLTITAWGVRIPQPSGDTLSVSAQTCDQPGDTVLSGCYVVVNSQDLAKTVGSCTANVSGKVGYFYKMGTDDNYSASNGSGYTPVAQWAAQNPGQYTQIGNYYYAFNEIGKATGVSGAAVADSNEMNGNYTGCSAWQTEYIPVEQSVQALASKFVTVQ